jgi:hypothetical protein
MADKSHSISITLPESVHQELKDFSFQQDCSASHVIATALTLAMPLLKEHPVQLKFMEFETVKLQLVDAVKTA